jgi:hypothetical protein
MSVQFVSRTSSISDLSYLSRFVIIMTPVDKIKRDLMHMALLDCKSNEILEGTNQQGTLHGAVYSIEDTIETYIKRRERAVDFSFCNKTDTLALYYADVPASHNEEIEKRWDEMDGGKYKYCINGKYGWNCETVVFYVLSG